MLRSRLWKELQWSIPASETCDAVLHFPSRIFPILRTGSRATFVDHSGDSPLSGASSVLVRDGSLQPLVQRHVRAVSVAYFSVIVARTHAESFVSLSAVITSVVVMYRSTFAEHRS